MFIRKSIIIVAATLAIAGGSVAANAAPTAGSLAGAKSAVETTTIALKKGKHHGKHHKHHKYHGHGPGFHGHWGPGYVGFYPPRRCRMQRVRVYDPYLGRRVWVRERVCYRPY